MNFAAFLSSRLSGYLFVGAAAALLASLAALAFLYARLDDTRRELAFAEVTTQTYNNALQDCGKALQAARDVAEHNRLAADAARLRARVATAAYEILRQETDRQIEELTNEADEIREADTGECRALTDPLPDDFVAWVWDD